MNRLTDSTLIVAWLLGASVVVAVAIRLAMLLAGWAANSPYAWGIG